MPLRLISLAELSVGDDCLVQGYYVVGENGDDQQKYAVPDEGVIKREPKPEKLKLLCVLHQ